jgi:transposase-like protein
MGATAEGRKELIAVIDGVRESNQSWQELLLDLTQRGLTKPLKFAGGDGALGLSAALREVYPPTKEQRYWVHKTANVLNKMPKALQAKATSDLYQISLAETREMAIKAFARFLRSTVRSTRPHAAASPRTARFSSLSITSPPSTGGTCGRPTASRAPSPRPACGIDVRRAAVRERPASP